jgi:Leucine-rich repeat (LRR) protein
LRLVKCRIKDSNYADKFLYLKSLKLSQNSLQEFKGQWPSLIDLDLSENKLVDFNATCPSLKYLNLRENEFEKFPLIICKSSDLTDLDISFNRIEIIPNEIKNLRNLERFEVPSNRLTDIDPVLLLFKLTYLNVSNNLVMKIPDGISNLQDLKNFSANYNQLTKLPEELCKLERTSFSVNGNRKLLHIPDGILALYPSRLNFHLTPAWTRWCFMNNLDLLDSNKKETLLALIEAVDNNQD